MEGGAEPLEVPEHPAAELEQHVLADPPRHDAGTRCRVTACTVVASSTTPTTVNSVVVSPVAWIGGMPRSMPSLTR